MRQSKVNHIFVNLIQGSSVIQIGDCKELRPFNQAYALEREKPIFSEHELVMKEIKKPSFLKKTEVNIERTNFQPICVDDIQFQSMDLSSILQIGSVNKVNATSHKTFISNLIQK